jgi:hypothetical protein
LFATREIEIARSPAESTIAPSDDEIYTGSILFVPPNDSNICRQVLFDNRTGRLNDNGLVDCERASLHVDRDRVLSSRQSHGDLRRPHSKSTADWFSGWRGIVARLDGICAPNPGAPREWRASFVNRQAARAALQLILAWPIDRVLIAHGEPAIADGTAFVRQAFAWLLKPEQRRA